MSQSRRFPMWDQKQMDSNRWGLLRRSFKHLKGSGQRSVPDRSPSSAWSISRELLTASSTKNPDAAAGMMLLIAQCGPPALPQWWNNGIGAGLPRHPSGIWRAPLPFRGSRWRKWPQGAPGPGQARRSRGAAPSDGLASWRRVTGAPTKPWPRNGSGALASGAPENAGAAIFGRQEPLSGRKQRQVPAATR